MIPALSTYISSTVMHNVMSWYCCTSWTAAGCIADWAGQLAAGLLSWLVCQLQACSLDWSDSCWSALSTRRTDSGLVFELVRQHQESSVSWLNRCRSLFYAGNSVERLVSHSWQSPLLTGHTLDGLLTWLSERKKTQNHTIGKTAVYEELLKTPFYFNWNLTIKPINPNPHWV
jgi:hypothetical protein